MSDAPNWRTLYEHNHQVEVWNRLWKRTAKKWREVALGLFDEIQTGSQAYYYRKFMDAIANAGRRKEWATVWKNRAHLDYMRAFQWRKLANKRLELLREIEKFVQVCPICLIRIVDHPFEIHKKASGHAEGCELKKELKK